MISTRTLLCALCAALLAASPQGRADFPTLALKPVSLKQIYSPTTITYAPDGSGRLFVCDQPGKIYIIQGGTTLPTPFLDITSLTVAQTTGYNERGLLGLAFHPGYATPASPGFGKFYVYYNKTYLAGTDPAPPEAGDPVTSVTVIAEYQVSAGDPNVADAASERRLLLFTRPQSNHNGGQLEFGPDGFLYIGSGDGGSQMDNNAGHTGGSSARPTNNLGNGQDKTRYLGKILRIDPLDPDGGGPLTYGIPASNPFFNDPTPGLKKEIYSYGMRNPWRFSFDKRPGGTNRLFCGEVGGDRVEEIDLIVAGGNYGWRYKEGTEFPTFSSGAATNPMTLPQSEIDALKDPIAMYAHSSLPPTDPTTLPKLGLSVTGGFVYRGGAIPALQGKYVFGDYGSTSTATVWNGRVMGLEETSPGSGVFTLTQAIPILGGNPLPGLRVLCLGEDESGEIYLGLKSNAGVLQLDNGMPAGAIYKLVPTRSFTTTVQASKDNTIFSEDLVLARSYSDGVGYLYAGRTGPNFGPYNRRALVAFDLAAAVPSPAMVQSAELKLNLTKAGPASLGSSFSVHRLTETWGEGTSLNATGGYGAPATTGDATWTYRLYDTSSWLAAGGSFTGTASATAVLPAGSVVSWTSSALAADVQAWLDTPASNAGWIIRGDETTNQTACQFSSVQTGGAPPSLQITYLAAPTNNGPTISGTLAGQAVTDKTTKAPFTGVTIADADLPVPTLAISVTLDSAAKGTFTTLNGFTAAGGGVYQFSGTAPAATTAIRGLVFTPTPNRVPSGSTETTIFTISANDGMVAPVTNNATTVVTTPINDAPSITAQQTLTTAEETALTIALANLTVTDPDNVYPTDFTLSVQDGANYAHTGNTVTPSVDFNGQLTVPVKVNDGAADSSVFNVMVEVTPINDAPSITGQQTLSTAEEMALTITLDNLTITDPDNVSPTDFTLSVRDGANYTHTGNTITPALNFNGPLTVPVRVNDGAADSSVFNLAVNVTPVNDPPSFTLAGDQSVPQEAPTQTVANFATAISRGPANESGQSLNFQVTFDHPELFATPPAISPTGTLTYAPAPTGLGTSTVTVQLHDSGGMADGGMDTSAAQTFKIAVTTFSGEVGTYNGLALPSSGAAPGAEKTGLLKFTLTKRGTFTGKLSLGAFSFALRGTIDNAGQPHFGRNGEPTQMLVRKNASTLLLQLHLDVATATDQVTGTITDSGAPFATITADRALYTSATKFAPPFRNVPPNLLGRYTVIFDAPTASGMAAADFPHGAGCGTLVVSNKGIAKITGSLADGTRVAYANALSRADAWPLWVRLAKGQGALAGPAHFETKTVPQPSDLDGLGLLWFRPRDDRAPLYTKGWPAGITTDLLGSTYVVPPRIPATSVLAGLGLEDADGNAKFTLTGGNLTAGSWSKALSISPKNKVTVMTLAADKLKLTISTASGVVKGTLMHPDTARLTKFSGVILQKQNLGSGFFLGPTESGGMTLVPKDAPGVP